MMTPGSTLEKEPPGRIESSPGPGERQASEAYSAKSGKGAGDFPPDGRGPRIFPLKTKGYIFLGVLVCYAAFLTVYVLGQKEILFARFVEMDKAYEAEWELRQADLSVFNSLMTIYTDIDSLNTRNFGTSHIRDNLEVIKTKFKKLESNFPEGAASFTALGAGLDAAIKEPTRHNLASLRKTLGGVRAELTRLVMERQDRLNALVNDYRAASENVTMNILALGLSGMALTMIFVGLFFTRLTNDLKTLERRAGEIVTGGKSGPEKNSVSRRSDEVGQLGFAIERMASALEERERELEIERKKMFHREKMAAIGTLAAGIAHEVGNPIAAISALVNETRKEQVGEDSSICANSACKGNLDFILHHTERLANITREISAFSTPQPEDRRLLDINAIARNASSLMKYDKRFSRVDLQLNLDSQLPAVYGVGDQLLQVIMNLLINASDALADVSDRSGTVTLSTEVEDGVVRISVTDNGHGMSQHTIDHAFEAFFTTKPVGKGTGLGLSLCHSIIAGHAGTMELESSPGGGAKVTVALPVNGFKEEGEEA
ncbi:MAG: sensor histidine kinase [Candidatus Nitrospinota bacterium M3_3B_026]